jgi:DNA (cytosine-5)-methyltransferase 1
MNILDLFSGIGGFSLGLERAGMRTVAFCEIDPRARAVLHKHWPDVPVFTDVSTLSKDDLNEQIDVIAGGFPCQDISTAGLGAGLSGSRSGLWFQFHRLIDEIRPRYAIIENVSVLRSRGLDQVLWSLAEIGYDAEWHCIPASAVGAPHRRDRIWIVAYPSSEGLSQRGQPFRQTCGAEEVTGLVDELKRCSTNVADADVERLQGCERRGTPSAQGESGGHIAERGGAIPISIGGIWTTEPDVGRVANGVPKRVDRLKQLGNAVVPQIPELIGRAIMEYERAKTLD